MLNMEKAFAQFIVNAKYEDIPKEELDIVAKQLIASFGAAIAGRDSDGCRALAEYTKEMGGKEEATILLWGGKVPAAQAALVNSCMARALDICDHINPGMHIGSALIPAALACAELIGGCSGREFLTAVAVGTEVALRLNLTDKDTDGFDPTGVIAMFAPAAACAKLMKLSEEQTLHALALAYNRCGSSFQSEVDGALSVRVMEGLVARAGIECARWAKAGLTGPKNFLNGVYGYYHNFGRDNHSEAELTETMQGLGTTWNLHKLSFKKYPSCGHTQGSTELLLNMMAEHQIGKDDIDTVELILNPFTARLVGKDFEPGDSPKVDAQFNVGYCVANAIVRAPVLLKHFEPEYIFDPEVLDYLHDHVRTTVEPKLHERGHYSSEMVITLKDGRQWKGSIDIPPGSPGNELAEEDFRSRYYDCVEFGGAEFMHEKADALFDALGHVERLADIREIIPLFLAD